MVDVDVVIMERQKYAFSKHIGTWVPTLLRAGPAGMVRIHSSGRLTSAIFFSSQATSRALETADGMLGDDSMRMTLEMGSRQIEGEFERDAV